MASYGNTARYALRKLLGTSLVSEVDDGIAALADDIDAAMVGYSQGPLGSRPAAGVAGRRYRAMDTSQEFMDTGSTWIEFATDRWRLVAEARTRWVGGETSGTKVFVHSGAMAASANAAAGRAYSMFRFDPADFSLLGRSLKARLRCMWAVNGTSPAGITFNVGMHPITASGGAAGVQSISLAAASLATGTFAPQADSFGPVTSAELDTAPGLPADEYAFGVVLSGAIAANSVGVLQAQLEVCNK